MRELRNWSGDYIWEILSYRNNDLAWNPELADERLILQLEDLFEPLSVLENMPSYANDDRDRYRFYFRLPETDLTKAQREDPAKIRWSWFPLDFTRDHFRGDTYYSVTIGRKDAIHVFDGKGERSKEHLMTISQSPWIRPIRELLDYLLCEIREGRYEPFVKSNLDYRLRTGWIKRKDYWLVYPEEKERFFARYDGINVSEFARLAESQALSKENATRFPRLSANQYCRYFLIGADALGIRRDLTQSLQNQYWHSSDMRSQNLHLIDGESEDAFDQWYEGRRYSYDHAFEYRYWENGTRIDLYISKDERGYYFHVSCSPQNEAGMRVILALAKEGVLTFLDEPQRYLERYRGDDALVFEPRGYYLNMGFPTEKVEEFINAVDWEEIPIARLSKHS